MDLRCQHTQHTQHSSRQPRRATRPSATSPHPSGPAHGRHTHTHAVPWHARTLHAAHPDPDLVQQSQLHPMDEEIIQLVLLEAGDQLICLDKARYRYLQVYIYRIYARSVRPQRHLDRTKQERAVSTPCRTGLQVGRGPYAARMFATPSLAPTPGCLLPLPCSLMSECAACIPHATNQNSSTHQRYTRH
jgi:hypothetical protein